MGDGRPQALEYASPPKKVKKPLPDFVFLLGWMLVFAACHVLLSVLVAGLGALTTP